MSVCGGVGVWVGGYREGEFCMWAEGRGGEERKGWGESRGGGERSQMYHRHKLERERRATSFSAECLLRGKLAPSFIASILRITEPLIGEQFVAR